MVRTRFDKGSIKYFKRFAGTNYSDHTFIDIKKDHYVKTPLVEMNYAPPRINLIPLFYYTVNENNNRYGRVSDTDPGV